ncbi:FUSC family protein [Flaviramulus sp. BrNp1-15]|uniref:FUSC family protein n=1 Tax=Flaviramulus sp. BrNp1-15 TaxID=2916754 RepID=UPI001EE89198|nr:FUSC family protein [Flaviramulus sp. BrNp1-15]ULC60758.1 FUSC family protein [Flaviramulus sp. BrNp1-15]
MKKLFTILAVIASIFAVLLSVLPVSNLAIIPAILALVFGLIAFYLSKKAGEVKKIIQFSFLLTIIALALTTYKAIFTETKVADTEVLEATEIKLEEEAIEELEELDIDDSELEGLEIEESDLEDIPIE